VRVLEAGPETGPPLLFLHGLAGLLDEHAFLERLAARYRVMAPELPGYGESTGEDLLEDMLDFTLHGWDVATALGLTGRRPHLVGHSLGGMIAAEMACAVPEAIGRLVLIDPFGVWLDEHPIPDLFSFLPFEFGDYLFRDQTLGPAMLTGGTDFSDPAAMKDFLVGNARRLGTAGKLLFPVPNRRLSKRLYRMTAETLLLWGESDQLVPPPYAARWMELLPAAHLVRMPDAAHMGIHEQPDAFAGEVCAFLDG
jgi:pimeloyl-ACP methyl ester carboxylesterase